MPPFVEHAVPRGLALVLAACLFWFAGERLRDGSRMAPLTAFVHQSWWGLGQAFPQTAMPSVIPRSGDGRAWSMLAQAALDRADRVADPAAREPFLALAETATQRALRLSPALASTWARLSLIAVNRDRAGLAVRALARSQALAPHGPGLAWPRAKLGLYLWGRLDGRARAGVATDVATVWHQQPTSALPYPRQALQRFAVGLNRQPLMSRLLHRRVAAQGARR